MIFIYLKASYRKKERKKRKWISSICYFSTSVTNQLEEGERQIFIFWCTPWIGEGRWIEKVRKTKIEGGQAVGERERLTKCNFCISHIGARSQALWSPSTSFPGTLAGSWCAGVAAGQTFGAAMECWNLGGGFTHCIAKSVSHFSVSLFFVFEM